MAKLRKKWQLRYRFGLNDYERNFPSQTKTYEWVNEHLVQAHVDHPNDVKNATVWLNEGDSRGWQRYDEIDLAELAALAQAQSK